MPISIHVPAWGTTARSCCKRNWYGQFQSTFPRGERPEKHGDSGYGYHFNPRSRVGNDDISTMFTKEENNFNPRSRVGNDAVGDSYKRDRGISIHVPAWGTTFKRCISAGFLIFQSTFPRGERRSLYRNTVLFYYFNPRSRVGNDCKFQQFFTYIFV